MTERQPTIDQVAQRAGVSRGTASRAMNHAVHVSAAAREKVRRAAQELGYVPNRAARALVTRRHEALALAVSGSDPQVLSHPFFAEVVSGINGVLDDTDLELGLVFGGTERGRERLRRQLSAQRVDGVLLLSLHEADPLAEVVERSGVPAVYCGRPLGSDPTYYVDADNYGGAKQATEYLLSTGRRRTASITGPLNMDVGVARHNGFRDAVLLAGESANRVVHGDFHESSGYRGMVELLAVHPDLDAVFVASDVMAFGALSALREYGRRVPDDVAVLGFDDLPRSEHTDPPLSTVRQPIQALGSEGTRMLLAVLEGQSVSSLILPTELVVRGSA